MPTRQISDEEYRSKFFGKVSAASDTINAKALERALDIRKFEIDLYWKRATYFWAFLAATFAGFVAIQTSKAANKVDMSVLLSSLGLVFSFGWLCVNRGSKYWQENWEYHVDMLEDAVQGPLYKVILARGRPQRLSAKLSHLLVGPTPISVSKINQLISVFVTLMWVGLLLYSLPPFSTDQSIDWYYVGIISLAVLACIGFVTVCRTYGGGYLHRGTMRTARLNK